MEKLTIEEIYCLQRFGMTTQNIRKTDLSQFDKLYDDNADQFDEWLDYAEKAFDKQEELGIITISCQDSEYPKCLTDIHNDAPALIFLLGNDKLLGTENGVAIIGARAADRQGLDAAFRCGAEYAKNGNLIVSGLAIGCDKAAHEGCLSVGGKTIAIVASGLDITHPKENVPLQKRILESDGLLLSEQVIGTRANGARLVARNRLQAALSKTVILAQCPEHSGSMHTMRFARKYRKNCLAVDFATQTNCNSGNKKLIEEGLANPLKL